MKGESTMNIHTLCNTVINTGQFAKIETVETAEKRWAVLIRYGREDTPYDSLGIYECRTTAESAITAVYEAMADGKEFFRMIPDQDDLMAELWL